MGGLAILLLAIVVGFRLGWELLRQNRRMPYRNREKPCKGFQFLP
jgi:hypothetical protein